MKFSGLTAFKAALTVLGLTRVSASFLTTIEPCPSATALSHAPITVSTQYQPVSTCKPTTACAKGQCSTIYPFTTYPYVSTVVPCAWNGTTTQTTTVTDIHQPFRASEYLKVLTKITAVPPMHNHRGFWLHWFGGLQQRTKQTTLYETVTRRAVAPFNEVGPLAIPSFDGSGLCHKCVRVDGSRSQLLAVMECRFGTDPSGKQYDKCVAWYETWIEQPPISTVVEAICSSAGTISRAGVYTWTFPQVAPPTTTTTTTTVTVTVNGRPSITVQPWVRVIPGQPWNAHVTKSFSGPTTFRFEVHVTKVIVLSIPYVTRSADPSRSVSVPTHSRGQNEKGDWWPIPGGDAGWFHTSNGGQAWQDWNPTVSSEGSSTTNRAQTSTTISSTSPGTSSLAGSSISSSYASATTGGSSSGNTATSSSSSGNTATSSSSSSSSGTITSASTTSTTVITPSGTGFYLQISGTPVTASLRARQTVVGYLGFDSSNIGIVVNDLSSAALVFKGNDGTTFFSNGRFLGTASRITSLVQRFLDFPSGFAVWDVLGIFAQLRDTAGFCFNNGFVFAYLESDPCENPIVLIPTNPSTSTNIASTSANTGTASTSITSTMQVSPTTTATESSSITPTSSSSPSSSTGSNGSSESSESAATSILTTVTSAGTSSSTSTGTFTSASAGASTGSSTTSSTIFSTGASTEGSTGASTVSSIGGSTGAFTTSLTESSIVSSTGGLTGDLTTSSTGGLTTSSTEVSTTSLTEESTTTSAEVSTTSLTEESTTSSIEGSTTSSTEDLTTTSTEGSITSSIEGSTTSSIEGSTTSSIEGSTISSTGASTGTSTGASSSTADSSLSTPLTSATTDFSSTASSTTSSAATTTTSSSPICDLNINICLNSELITANSVATYNCPLLGGLLCTLNDLLSAIPQVLGLNPNVNSVLVGNNQVIGLSITPEQVSAAFDLGELDNAACDLLGGPISVVLRDPTCPNPPSTSSTSSTESLSTLATSTLSSTTTLAESTSVLTTISTTTTTTSAAATSTTAAPQCNAQMDFCAALVVPWTVMLQACPNVLGCSDAQMQAFANSFIGQPGVQSVAYANNIAYGFSLTASQLQAQLGILGPINTLCTVVDIFTLQISDSTCPATALPAEQCNVDVSFCLTESLDSAGITSGTCTNGILPCLPSQVTSQALDTCNSLGSACKAYGNNLLTPLTASQSVAQIQESIAAYALSTLCVAGTTVTLSDSSCSPE